MNTSIQLLVSEGPETDHRLAAEGHTFLGIISPNFSELHLFRKKDDAGPEVTSVQELFTASDDATAQNLIRAGHVFHGMVALPNAKQLLYVFGTQADAQNSRRAEADRLGFGSVARMVNHERWLMEHATPEYLKWAQSVMTANSEALVAAIPGYKDIAHHAYIGEAELPEVGRVSLHVSTTGRELTTDPQRKLIVAQLREVDDLQRNSSAVLWGHVTLPSGKRVFVLQA